MSTSQLSGDDFADAMWQHMQTVNNAATAKINELRKEVKHLRAEVERESEARYVIQAQLWEALEELERRSTVWPKPVAYSILETLRRGPEEPSTDSARAAGDGEGKR